MTTGIYALYWEEQDLIYIGLSQGIEGRYKKHLRDMKNQKHTNYKVQNAFNSYNIPTLFILEICLLEELNAKEIQWTKEFDALGKQGLCIIEAGTCSGFGENSGNSKYSNLQIIEVFNLLIDSREKTYREIAEITKVTFRTVKSIAHLNRHTWLKAKFPEKYVILEAFKGIKNINVKNKGTRYPAIVDTLGNVYHDIPNISLFSREHNLDSSNITKVLQGKVRSHKGWTLA